MSDHTRVEIFRAIRTAIESRLHLIGSVIEGESRRKILERNIKAEGDFLANTGYAVEFSSTSIDLIIGSNVPHEPYVLGGKVPSWTPIEPLKAWVECKGLSWADKAGKPLSIEQMAYMIRGKIKREGIPARNVFAEVIRNRQDWIFKQMDSIEVAL
ncbi:MAG: hypothetical protein K8R90_02140 [Candidatus Cloacimonetes bacterium]|nr:hypothetical protein [Candidatus Cloacimonadota bacterium]